MQVDFAVIVPQQQFANKECVMCENTGAELAQMTQTNREIMTQEMRNLCDIVQLIETQLAGKMLPLSIAKQLRKLADDIRKIEVHLLQDTPLFAHPDCVESSKHILSSTFHDWISNR